MALAPIKGWKYRSGMTWPLVGRASILRDLGRILDGSLPAGVVICGDAGVGKTRLLAELTDNAASSGWATEWVTGAVSTASVPMGALAPFIPQQMPQMADPVQFMVAMREALLARHEGRMLLLAVDDVPRLDSASASFVAQLAVMGYCFVACSARSGESLPPPIEALVKDQVMNRVELAPLMDADVETLVQSHLDGQVDPAIAARAVRLVRGNPLFLRELLADGVESGSLKVVEGSWVLEEPFGGSTGVRNLVATRLGKLSDRQRDGLEALAIAEPLELEMAEAFFDESSLVDLERRGVIRIVVQGRRHVVEFAHPLFGETIGTETPVTRRRVVAGELLRATVAAGARRREDILRLAIWHLDSGEPIDRASALAAAQFANAASDHDLAERIAQRVFEAEGDFFAGLELGEAIARQGRAEDADLIFRHLSSIADSDHERAALALKHADSAFFYASHHDRATEILEDARARITDPTSMMLLDSQLILMLAFKPDPKAALTKALELIDAPDAPDEAVLGVATVLGLVAMWRCDIPTVYRATERGLSLLTSADRAMPDVGARLTTNELVCQTYDGRVEEAVQGLRDRYKEAITPPIDDFAAIWAIHYAVALAIRGQVRDAVEVGRKAVLLGDVTYTGNHDGAAGLQAVVAGQAGDQANVTFALERLQTALKVMPPTGFWMPRGQAWQHALTGDLQSATKFATRASAAALADGMPLVAAWSLYDTVLFGQPSRQAVEDLESIAMGTTAITIKAYAQHATALLARDPLAVEEVAAGFQSRSELLYAVTAYLQAAGMYRDQNKDHAATRAATKARQLDTQLPPEFFTEKPPGLTKRESEIASLAAQGFASQQIADRLFVSVRTVNNHLATTYTKLGVHSREELAGVMQPS